MASIDYINPDVFTPILDQIAYTKMSQDDALRSIAKSLEKIERENQEQHLFSYSQSAAFDRTNASSDRFGRNTRHRFSRQFDDEVDFRFNSNGVRNSGQSFNREMNKFTEALENQLWQSLTGDPIAKTLAPALNEFAEKIGTDITHLSEDLGKMLADKVADAVKESDFGSELTREINNLKNKSTNTIQDVLNTLGDTLKGGGNLSDIVQNVGQTFGESSGLSGALTAIRTAFEAGGVEAAGSAIVELGAAALQANYALVALAAASYLIDKFSEAIQPAIEGAKKFGETLKLTANREQDYAKKQLQNYRDRIKKDNETYIRAPFEILKKSAEEVEQAWNNVITLVGQTQGYNKEAVQDLWSAFASRLKAEGLDSVVSSVDIMTNLEKVLKSGLSGKVAEEFAYLATKLNSAIPTQDFFQYASTYASIAANAIKDGQSQTQAIQTANQQLEEFASNLLYSSRQLAGGFTTGLANASDLFDAATRITVAAHTGNVSEVSGVLTSVSAIVGAIAPDLTSSIVSKITEAATGGNASNLVALRSLAGTGASNTAFLQALASNPQEVFTTMFTNLASMQNMYGDNYMEVASSLADTFGMTIDELSRVDFGYLAQAVEAMDFNSNTLEQNLALLSSGQTTQTADQLRMQQINKYMIDEGLSYVLDNEVARAIQEHMWEEQIANELMENEYSVDLVGAGREFLQSLIFSVDNIFNILNPFSWTKKVASLIATGAENSALNKDIKKLLEMQNIGNSHPDTLYNLTHGNTNLKLTKSYIELLGGRSTYRGVQTGNAVVQGLLGNIPSIINSAKTLYGDVYKGLMSSSLMASRTASAASASSQYSWSTIGKSMTRELFGKGNRALYNSGSAYPELNLTPQQIISSKAAQTMQTYLDTMQTFVDENKTYQEWAESAKEYGIEDLGSALADYGLSEAEAKGKFGEMEAYKAAMYEHERDVKEEQFWDDMIKWAEEGFPAYSETIYQYNDDIIFKEDTLITNTDLLISELEKSNKQLKEFYDQWIDYYVNHTVYHRDTLNAHEVEAIRTAERGETGDAVLALAQALTDNMVNLQDPEVQQNVLLSKILLVLEAMLQLQNNTTTVSLPQSLSLLGLGVTSVDNQY